MLYPRSDTKSEVVVVIYLAFCLDETQCRTNGARNENRTHS